MIYHYFLYFKHENLKKNWVVFPFTKPILEVKEFELYRSISASWLLTENILPVYFRLNTTDSQVMKGMKVESLCE